VLQFGLSSPTPIEIVITANLFGYKSKLPLSKRSNSFQKTNPSTDPLIHTVVVGGIVVVVIPKQSLQSAKPVVSK